jgi:hypothetical protein
VERGKKPVVAAYSAAFKNDNQPTSPIYISLTIKAAEGHEKSSDLYGIKRIAIFANGFKGNILLKLIDLVAEVSVDKNKVLTPSIVKAPSKYELSDITTDFNKPKQVEENLKFIDEKPKTFDDKLKNFDPKKKNNDDKSSDPVGSDKKKMKKVVSIFESGLVKKRMVKYQQELIETPATEGQIDGLVKLTTDIVLLAASNSEQSNELTNETVALQAFLDGTSNELNAHNPKLNIAAMAAEQRIFKHSLPSDTNQSSIEKFVIGDTHLYNVSLLSPDDKKYLVKSVQDSKSNHVPLNCGVYSDKTKKTDLILFAAAMSR